jgi:hypothetical protein
MVRGMRCLCTCAASPLLRASSRTCPHMHTTPTTPARLPAQDCMLLALTASTSALPTIHWLPACWHVAYVRNPSVRRVCAPGCSVAAMHVAQGGPLPRSGLLARLWCCGERVPERTGVCFGRVEAAALRSVHAWCVCCACRWWPSNCMPCRCALLSQPDVCGGKRAAAAGTRHSAGVLAVCVFVGGGGARYSGVCHTGCQWCWRQTMLRLLFCGAPSRHCRKTLCAGWRTTCLLWGDTAASNDGVQGPLHLLL